MARRAVTQRQLLQIYGIDDVLDKIAKVLDKTTGNAVKDVYIDAAKPLWAQVKRNIAALPVSPRVKEILDAEMMINRGQDRKQHVLAGMSQQAGIKKLGLGGRFILSPYWVEFGTSSGMRPHAYFRPALAATRAQIRSKLEAGFKEIIKDATK